MPSRNYTYLFSLLIASLLVFSCTESANNLATDSDQKLKLMGELLPNQRVKIEVSSTIPFLSEKEYLEVNQEFDVVISGNEITEDLVYRTKIDDLNGGMFELDLSSDYEIIPGNIYNISVNTPHDDVLNVSANTEVPFPSDFEFIEMEDYETFKNMNDPKMRTYTYTVRFKINRDINDDTQNRFFHIIPQRRIVYIDGGGSQPSPNDYTSTFLEHENFIFHEGGQACSVLRSKTGFLVDMNDLEEDDSILVEFSSIEEFHINEEQHRHIHFRLYSVTDKFYSYHKSLTSAINANSFNIEETVLDKSNVVNGRGLITGMSMKLDSTRVKTN